MSVFKPLYGERINGIMIGNDGWSLVFRTVDGKYFQFDTQNDCCNTVWFNHMTGVTIMGDGNSFDLLRGVLVTSSEDKGWSEDSTENNYEVIQDGFWTIHTDRGYIDIEVRNSHNGYYGGHVVYNQEGDINAIEGLKEIHDDF